MTFEDTSKFTCSPASAAGRTLFDLLDSPTTANAGRPLVPALPSPRPESRKPALSATARTLCRALDELASSYAAYAGTRGLPTTGTYGRKCGASSATADRNSSWESRLRARMDGRGSPLYALRWKYCPMPLGERISQLQASAFRTRDSVSSGWPTPNFAGAQRGGQAERMGGRRSNLIDAAQLASWPSPQVSRGDYQRDARTGEKILKLEGVAKLAGWNTPQVSDATGPRSLERQRDRRLSAPKRTNGGAPGFGNLNDQAQLAGWATPAANAAGGAPEQFLARKAKAKAKGAELGVSLTSLSMQAAWATPAARDFRHANATSFSDRGGGKKGEQLNNQVVHSGPMSNGSTAETASGGQLNPAFSLSLMGYRAAWHSCGVRAIQSFRRSRRTSSK